MLASQLALLLLAAPPGSSVALDEQLTLLAKGVATGLRGKEVRRLAVADFVSITGEQTTVTKYLSEQFTTDLVAQDRSFQVVDRSHLNAILAESDQQKRLARDGLLDQTTISKLGVAGVDAVLIGTITVLTSVLDINLKVLDVQTATIHLAVKSSIEIPQIAGRPNSEISTRGDQLPLSVLVQRSQASPNSSQGATKQVPKGKETPDQKRIREQAEKIEKQKQEAAKRTAVGLRNAAISGCTNGNVTVDLRAVDTFAGGWLGLRGPSAKIRIINLHSSPVDISDESGQVVRNFCAGGGITLFRSRSTFTDGRPLEFQYMATGRFPDGSLGRQQSQRIYISTQPGEQNLTWEIQLQKVYSPQ
jgi:hypothetical protein